MKRCPHCSEESQDEDRFCRRCGRDLGARVAGEHTGGLFKGCAIAAGVFILICVLMVGACLIAIHNAPKPPAKSVAETAEDHAAKMRFLWNNDSRYNDLGREYIIKETLRKGGYRCDKVLAQVMREPGNWTFRCSPGYVYRFRFDSDGNLVSAERL